MSQPEPTPAPVVAPTEGAAAAATAPDASGDAAPKTKLKKLKYAIAFGYCGAGYHGLQSNADPTNPAIEDVIVPALHKAGLISDDNMEGATLKKIGWQRASRTDKGVSALRNLASAKLLSQPDGDEAAIVRINTFLPPAIKVFGLQPVTAGFNSHLHCTGRVYQYYLPTYGLLPQADFQALLPPSIAPSNPSKEMMDEGYAEPDDDDDRRPQVGEKRSRGGRDDVDAANAEAEKTAAAAASQPADAAADNAAAAAPPQQQGHGERFYMFQSIPPDAMARLRAYRITPETLELARGYFRMYGGTQSFHNFTPKGRSSDPSMMRYMRHVTVSDPFLATSSSGAETEFVRIEVDGQSFMLNQIRKMIGTVMVILAAGLDGGFLRSTLDAKVHKAMPMAPANGLFLEDLFFDKYNYTLERIQGAGSNAVAKQPIVMAKCSPDSVEAVRAIVLRSIADEEAGKDVTGRWMRGIRFICRLSWNMDVE